MTRRTTAAVCLALVTAPHARAGPGAAPETGVLAGVVRTHGGEPAPGVCVVVCDAQSGVPLDADNLEPFTTDASARNEAFQRILFVLTGHDGGYKFSLPSGAYRLVAQAWDETPGQVLGVNGADVRLFGVSGVVELDAGETERADLAPPGRCTLAVYAEAGNSDSVFIVSSEPTRADPILGFAGWRGPFIRSMLGGNRAPLGRTVFRGLPAGEVHVAVFSPDNLPGWGAASVTLKPDEPVEVDVPWIAAWSDAIQGPPADLRALTNRLAALTEEARTEIMRSAINRAGITGDTRDMLGQMAALGSILLDPVELPDGTRHPTGEVLAALAYAKLGGWLRDSGREPNPHHAAQTRPYKEGP